MQRILQPGEIESLDHTSFPRVLLPNTSSLFLERASRIRQLAEGNPIADYLNFIASLVQAQHRAVQDLRVAEPEAAAIARQHLQDIEARIARLETLRTALASVAASCDGGRIADCRVIEAIAEVDLPVEA